MQRKPAFQMLWFVSIVFTDFHKYFIVYGALFCFVLCSVERDSIVEATFVDNFYCLYFFNVRRREGELSKYRYSNMYTRTCIRTMKVLLKT